MLAIFLNEMVKAVGLEWGVKLIHPRILNQSKIEKKLLHGCSRFDPGILKMKNQLFGLNHSPRFFDYVLMIFNFWKFWLQRDFSVFLLWMWNFPQRHQILHGFFHHCSRFGWEAFGFWLACIWIQQTPETSNHAVNTFGFLKIQIFFEGCWFCFVVNVKIFLRYYICVYENLKPWFKVFSCCTDRGVHFVKL